MIIFENPGEIDVSAITTFGVSVKEGENPIGFFGTGLKYAIAILLRNGHKIKIFSGADIFVFGTEVGAVRGKPFEFITIASNSGAPARLGFTTQVGKTWELWMAYRELFCNARDEYGEVVRSTVIPEPTAGRTFVIVEGSAFESIHAGRWEYLIEDSPDLTLNGMEIFRRSATGFFYRGVRVGKLPRQSLYTYNDTMQLDLTEDRSVKNHYEINYRIVRALMQSDDEMLLQRVLTAPEEIYEHHLDYHGWSGAKPAETFLKVVGSLLNNSAKNLNKSAVQVYEDFFPKQFNPTPLEMTSVQHMTLERAVKFSVKIGFPVDDYPIIVCETLGDGGLGRAHDGKIYVAERAFHMGGTKQVASTLIEESVHLKYGYEDCTREMQNFLFEKMCSMGEELIGAPA